MKLVLLHSVVVASAMSLADLKSDRIERGRYLVEEVGQCGECHTPRDEQGRLDRSRWLKGATVWFRPIRPVSDWAYTAPAIAGLGSFTGDQVRQVLQKGLGPQGNPVRQPMHRYNLKPDDAEAIVAYLQSLK
jgi:mono/diheme cytochrome c family protein